MKLFIAVIISLFTVFSLSNSQTWTKVEGTSSYVNFIYFLNPSTCIVASDIVPTDFSEPKIPFPDFGVGQNGYQISTDSANTFGTEILKDYSVYSIAQLPTNPDYWIAAVRQFNDGSLVVSTDAGKNWDLSSLKCVSTSQIVGFAVANSADYPIIAADANSSKGMIYSKDTFKLCSTNDNFVIQARAVKTSTFNNKLIFIGGDKSLQNFYRSNDGGKTWIGAESGLEGKRVLCLLPSKWNEAVIYCGVDSLDANRKSIGKGIYQSLDTGRTWKLVGANNKRVFSIAQHPINPKVMAAACDSDGVYFSGSYGYGWERYGDGFPANTSVRVVEFPKWESNASGSYCYAGTYGSGLYKSKRVATEINETKANDNIIVNLYPNPSTDNIQVIINSNANSFEYRLLDIFGNQLKGDIVNSQTVQNILNIDVSSISSGTYFLHVRCAGNQTIQKINILK